MQRLWRDGSAEYYGRHFDFARVHAESKRREMKCFPARFC
jgi:hypothetical protein